MCDIDRTDYYHPTTVEIYFRRAFAPWKGHALARPIRPYNQ
jgi:hypothetical protein